MKSPYAKLSVFESVFNQIAGINSRFAPLRKKNLHQKHLPLNILELSVLLQEGLTQTPFFHNIVGCVLQGCNFIRELIYHILSQNMVFKTASVGYIFKKVSVMSYLNSKVAV